MSAPYDAIVIGVGTMGASAALALARRGLRVLGLEQFDIPHAQGAHHGQSRMFRMSYYEHPDYVPLLRRSLELWRGLESESSQSLLHLTGAVYLGRPEGELVSRSAEAARIHGLPHELLSASALRDRYPQFAASHGYAAMAEEQAGFVVPERAVSAMASLAIQSGAELRAREGVLSWRRAGDEFEVSTSRGVYTSKRLIFTCGAWTSRLVKDLGIELLVTRQVMGWVDPPKPERFALDRFPCWAAEIDGGSVHYGFPILPWHPGLKVAHHFRGAQADPDAVDRSMSPADEADFRVGLQHLNSAEGPTLSAAVCTYTNSPDSHFIIDRHPHATGVTIACGFSGHGFKFAPVVGEILAGLAVDGSTKLPAQFLGLRRFAR